MGYLSRGSAVAGAILGPCYCPIGASVWLSSLVWHWIARQIFSDVCPGTVRLSFSSGPVTRHDPGQLFKALNALNVLKVLKGFKDLIELKMLISP